jgi:hypothetical protein
MSFTFFKTAVARQFARMSTYPLFRTAVSKDDLWRTYLDSFPAGSNPIYRTRTEHDCSCCKQFIRAVGDVVAVIEGKVVSIWDTDIGDPNYQVVADAMARAVHSHGITDAFLHYEKTAGTEKNFEDTVDGVHTWEHFFINIPAKYVMKNINIPTKLNDHRTARDVLARGLTEITGDSLTAVLELIAQNSLYRGEEHKFAITEFLKVKSQFAGLTDQFRHAFVWTQAMTLPASVSRFRNTSIGTLLTDLSTGVDLEDAVKSFEAKVAPLNYKRPTALVTKAMIDKAKTKIEELGLTSALERRYATIDDITVNNVMYANRGARRAMKADVFAELASTVPVKTLGKVEDITIADFIANVLPSAKTIEVMPENRHSGNFVSLIAPVDPTAASLFKWGNNFSWSYNGDVADSMRERVKAAGGSVEGVLCCRLAWDYIDDLDFHMYEPGGSHIYYGTMRQLSGCGGMLDVDANGCSGMRTNPVENIFYASKARMRPGMYTLQVQNFSRRQTAKKGFEVEIEFGGTTHYMVYEPVVTQPVEVAQIQYDPKTGFSILKSLPTSSASKLFWGISTQTFVPVNVLMQSPNHWDGQGVGNRHYFFMLNGCANAGQARGFYNEFLKSDLDAHRKVIEMVGAKMRTDESAQQLSGLGFSSTQRNTLTCRVTGSFTRVLNIVF